MTSIPLDPPAARPHTASLSCPNCGAAIALLAQGWAVTIACASCGAVLDANDPNFQVLQRQRQKITVTPRLPLGTRGTWRGAAWELIGFQQVTITVDDVDYSWTEYVAFNPYRGFLYLSEYEGHWNVIEKLRRRPHEAESRGRPVALHDNTVFRHFQSAQARTTAALGEFPWEVRVGDTIEARDYISPPYILSAESSDGETTWSLGTYTPPEVIAKAFPSKEKLRSPSGVFANQPNPHSASASRVLRQYGLFLALLFAILMGNMAMSRGTVAFEQSYSFTHGTDDVSAFVTPPFILAGRPSSVVVDISANLDNDWVYYDFTLIHEVTGDSREFSKQVSYYSGRDSDGNWSEGSRKGSVRLSSVPPGRYFLRVAPEGGEPQKPPVPYTLRVRRDVPSYGFYVLAFFALTLPAILFWIRKAAFETQRWAESDYGTASGTASDDSGDDE